MSTYSITLFLHIAGALGFFTALGLERMILGQLGCAATTDEVRRWIGIDGGVRRLGMASMVTLLLSGFAMMAIAQIGGAWLIVSFWMLVALSVLAIVLSGRRMADVKRNIPAGDGPVSPALQSALHHPLLWVAIKLRVAIALGIVFLMTVKPPLLIALLVVGVAAIIGLASALPFLRRVRTHQEPAV
jgi:hypothetical protein